MALCARGHCVVWVGHCSLDVVAKAVPKVALCADASPGEYLVGRYLGRTVAGSVKVSAPSGVCYAVYE